MGRSRKDENFTVTKPKIQNQNSILEIR